MTQDNSDNKPKEPKYPSRAPAPINPLSGRGGGTLIDGRPSAKTPEWREWNHTPSVTHREACALSMNIDPHSIKYNYASSKLEPDTHDITIKDEFALRLRVLERNAYSSHFTVSTTGEVPLDEFSHWASSVVAWPNLPSELVAMAQKKRDSQTNSPAAKISAAPVTNLSVSDWKSKARQIGKEICDKNPTFNMDKIAEKTYEKMMANKCEVGMTGRGDKVPSAETIKRHALTGIKT